MKSAFLLMLAVIAIMAIPAQADTFNFNDEYYINSAATFATVFPGARARVTAPREFINKPKMLYTGACWLPD